MLTPKFSLSQNADFLFINLHVPYIKTENAECDANEDEFYFSAKPYYLRLYLPGKVVNDDRLKSEYDVDKGDLSIRVAKEVPGQNFGGLDMLTKLLTPKQTFAVPNIEVLETQQQINDTDPNTTCQSESVCDSVHHDIDTNTDEEFDFDWFIEQKVTEGEGILTNKAFYYGFANQKCNVIGDICSEIDPIDLKDPDNVPAAERTLLREKQEEQHFDCEHYLADFFDDDLIQDAIASDYPVLTGVGSVSKDKFIDSEKERLLRLPRREYLIENEEVTNVCLGLVDLVYAYSYNYRFCGGENNIESDWTICKLSATLSWLDYFQNLKDVVVSCARRTLCFPLYRSWKLFERVFRDVRDIFRSGKHQILKCLLGIHSILEKSENRYILNDLYITDYCVWIQSVDCRVLDSLALNLAELNISKEDVGFLIVDIERDAEKLMLDYPDDEESVDEITKKMNVVHIANVNSIDSDDDEEEDKVCDKGEDENNGDEEEDEDSDDEEEDEDSNDDEEDEDSDDEEEGDDEKEIQDNGEKVKSNDDKQ